MEGNLKDLFYDALSELGIEYERYGHMPFFLRKETLAFNIYQQISTEFEDGEFIRDRFYEIDIYYYSEEELETHNRIINACIALVCLGHNDYIKPLVGYLDFPEWRLTAKIDYLLASITKRYIHHRIPTFTEKVEWQKLFARDLFYSDLPDLSEEIFPGDKRSLINYYEYSVRNFSEEGIVRHKTGLENKKIIDELECMNYYYVNCYRYLQNNDYVRLIKFLNQSFDAHTIPYMDSISKSLIDVFNDLEINEDAFFWKKILSESEIDTLQSIFFSKILGKMFRDDSWSAFFVNEYFDDQLDSNHFKILAKLYKPRSQDISLDDVVEIFLNYHDYPIKTKQKIDKLEPLYIHQIRTYINATYLNEKQSISFFNQHNKPKADELTNAFLYRFDLNTEVLRNVVAAEKIRGTHSLIMKSLLVLCERRENFLLKIFLESDKSEDDPGEEYDRCFSAWRQMSENEVKDKKKNTTIQRKKDTYW